MLKFLDRFVMCAAGTYLVFGFLFVDVIMHYGYSLSVATAAAVSVFTDDSIDAAGLHTLVIGIALCAAAMSFWVDTLKLRFEDRHFSSLPSWR